MDPSAEEEARWHDHLAAATPPRPPEPANPEVEGWIREHTRSFKATLEDLERRARGGI